MFFSPLSSFLSVARLAERVDGQVDPFDDTRVHPECYNTQDWAQRICANALDVQVRLMHLFPRLASNGFHD